MLYFSELKNKKIFTEDNIYVGKLKDMVFQASEAPYITNLVAKSHKKDLMIPMEYLKDINKEIIISKGFKVSELQENELFMTQNLLDNQIIDITGDKLVRVNDIAIQDKPGYFISGVDIGLLGIMRWFGLDDYLIRLSKKFNINLSSQFLSWADIHPLELSRGHVKIKKELTKLQKIRPEDLADYLERTNVSNISRILNVIDEHTATGVIENLNINYQTELFRQFEPKKGAKIIAKIDAEEAADILISLTKKRRNEILDALDSKSFEKITHLLNLSRTPVGHLLTTEYLAVPSSDRVKDVIFKVNEKTREYFVLFYVYVLNEKEELVGVFNLHELLLQKQETSVYKFMHQNLITIHLNTPEAIVLRKLVKYKLYSLPVISKENKIMGVVTFDDVIDRGIKHYE